MQNRHDHARASRPNARGTDERIAYCSWARQRQAPTGSSIFLEVSVVECLSSCNNRCFYTGDSASGTEQAFTEPYIVQHVFFLGCSERLKWALTTGHWVQYFLPRIRNAHDTGMHLRRPTPDVPLSYPLTHTLLPEQLIESIDRCTLFGYNGSTSTAPHGETRTEHLFVTFLYYRTRPRLRAQVKQSSKKKSK